ncbi:hypothetical protein KKF91_20505, partial [Myxococcota bacterium]|nr:hypothetical protein [Myxococcota bacterium]
PPPARAGQPQQPAHRPPPPDPRANAPRRPPRPAPVHDLYGSARKTPPKRSVRNNNTALLGAIGFVGLLGLLLILFALLHTPQDAGRRGDAGVEELVGE